MKQLLTLLVIILLIPVTNLHAGTAWRSVGVNGTRIVITTHGPSEVIELRVTESQQINFVKRQKDTRALNEQQARALVLNICNNCNVVTVPTSWTHIVFSCGIAQNLYVAATVARRGDTLASTIKRAEQIVKDKSQHDLETEVPCIRVMTVRSK